MKTLSKILAPVALLAMALAGCSGESAKSGSKLAGEATFDPAPADKESIEAQLKRFKGQTKFLTPYDRYYRDRFSPAAADRAASPALGGGRAIQESDIFKVGKPGSKLLFLLNNYRGLQVVSFEDGAEQPKLVGRVDATGNWPENMYYDAQHDQLIVLENNYQNDQGDAYDYSDVQSRLLVYDVSTPTAPRIAQTIELKGTLSESRMVGDVLYVATSVRPNYYARTQGAEQKSKGFVYSFNLQAEQAALVETHELSASVAWGESMNVVEVKDGDAYKYYLIAVLSKSTWGWWDRESIVEVVDISDAQGDIKPVMVVNAKGAVRERSQTHVKNGTLIVTSNSLATDQQTLRVAVETFKFPTESSEILTPDEAQYRKLHVEREVAKKEKALRDQGVTGDQLDEQLKAFREERLADAELGLKGRFVRESAENGGEALLKPAADSVVTVGSTQGLSASVQDVRYEGDLLYVYWVPANQIDPLDVFDISKPEEGVKHLSRLEFDGWIQRAIPVTYEGRQFILGLGWIVPADDDQMRRYPQAVLFEVSKTAGGRVKAEVLAQKNLGSSSTWANFQAQDKMIEIRFTDAGAGVIMYTFSSWDGGTWLNGGKLIGFDIKQADVDHEKVFTEGGVLAGDDGWLRRIFTNPEIDRVNTFADTALGVYPVSSGLGAANSIVSASAILELARNVQTYTSITKNGQTRGVQVVSQSYWSYDGDTTTELRLVDAARPDAEKAEVLSTLKLEGSYIDQTKDANGDLLVLTQRYSRVQGSDTWSYRTEFFIHKVTLAGEGSNELTAVAKASWEPNEATGPRLGWQQRLVKLASGRILAATGYAVKELAVPAEGGIVANDVTFDNCTIQGSESAGLVVLGGKLYLTYSEVVKDPVEANLSYLRNFVAPVTDGDGLTRCEAAVNIPGTVVNVVDGRQVITNDTRLIDRAPRGQGDGAYVEMITENALASLALASGDVPTAKLVDLYDPKNVAADSMKVFEGDKLVFIESTARQRSWWGWGRGMIDDVWARPSFGTRTEQRLAIVGFTDELEFTKVAYDLNLPLNSAATLNALFPSPKAEEGYLAVVGQGQKLQVLALADGERPVVKKLQKVSATGEKGEPKDVVTLQGYYWYWSYGNTGIHFTPSQRSLEIPQGLFGVAQVYVAE